MARRSQGPAPPARPARPPPQTAASASRRCVAPASLPASAVWAASAGTATSSCKCTVAAIYYGFQHAFHMRLTQFLQILSTAVLSSWLVCTCELWAYANILQSPAVHILDRPSMCHPFVSHTRLVVLTRAPLGGGAKWPPTLFPKIFPLLKQITTRNLL